MTDQAEDAVELNMLLVLALFVATGVASPLLISLLQNNGACESTTLLFVLPNYFGMAGSILVNRAPEALRGKRGGYSKIAEQPKDSSPSPRISSEQDDEKYAGFVSSPSTPSRAAAAAEKKNSAIPHLLIFLLCILDVISASMNFTGLVYAGSAIFTVVYSSMTMYTAIFSWIILGRKLKALQWLGIWVIVMGLSLTSVFVPSTTGPEIDVGDGGGSSNSNSGSDNGGGEGEGTKAPPLQVHIAAPEILSESSRISLGIFLVVCGSLFHSLSYILSEIILTSFKGTVTPVMLSTTMGIFGCVVFGMWQLIYTVPRFQTLVLDEIAKHQGDINVIWVSYIVLAVSSLVHAVTFFSLIQRVGSTTTGVLKGVQSVLVFVLSHYLFCSVSQAQCFTETKGVSLGLVLLGVFLYSYFASNEEDGDDSDPSDGQDEDRPRTPTGSLSIELPASIRSSALPASGSVYQVALLLDEAKQQESLEARGDGRGKGVKI